jgi:V8-like Glu-specific endopeptidase
MLERDVLSREVKNLWVEREIIGRDDRTKVADTTVAPFEWICHLALRLPNENARTVGTGALIGPRHVLTAAHLLAVLSKGRANWTIGVTPGRHGKKKPFGEGTVSRWRINPRWADTRVAADDYALLTLKKPFAAIGSWSPLTATSDADVDGRAVLVAGYPTDKKDEQWCSLGTAKIDAKDPRRLRHDADTKGGTSGAPIWTGEGAKARIVGVHSKPLVVVRGGKSVPTANAAARVDDDMVARVAAWMKADA